MPPQTKWRKGSVPFDPSRDYGFLEILEVDEERSAQYQYIRYWKCRCRLCGTTKSVKEDHLKHGKIISCGCYRAARATKHGMHETPEYIAWQNMVQRCTNKEHPNYENYGGRGITVCQEWIGSFQAFYDHVGPRPTSKHSVERVENNGNYEPGNVEWKTMHDQSRNKRNNRYYELDGESLTLTDWCERFGISLSTVRKRMRCGMELRKALTTPINTSYSRG